MTNQLRLLDGAETRLVEEIPQPTLGEVRWSWMRAAPDWCAFVREGYDVHRRFVHGTALLDACGTVHGRRVLDIGCGEGWCSRELARRGATVVGVDVCPDLLDAARDRERPGGSRIDFLEMDAAQVHAERWPAQFDLVTACMSLHTMPDPASVLLSVRRVLAPGGRMVISIPHPAMHMLGGRQHVRESDDAGSPMWMRVGRYWDSRAYRVHWRSYRTGGGTYSTIRWSRSYAEYRRLCLEAGFTLRDLQEARASADHAEYVKALPRLSITEDIPLYQIIVWS